MRKAFLISFLVSGVTAIISQLAVIREAAVIFSGNELFLGPLLGFWLLWAAAGSIILTKLFFRKRPVKTLIVCHFLVPFLFFADVVLLRLGKKLLAVTGESPDFILSAGYLFLVTAPLCLILGLQFAVLSRLVVIGSDTDPGVFKKILAWLRKKFFSSNQASIAYLVGHGYFYQVLGLALGGVLYAAFFMFINAANIFFFLALVNFFVILLLVNSKKSQAVSAAWLVLFLAIWLVPAIPGYLENKTLNWLYAGQEFVETKNSFSGNMTVTKAEGQYNFYQNGIFAGSTKNDFTSEAAVHLSLLYHFDPVDVLLVGGGFSTSLAEILKYPVKNVYYAESDLALIGLANSYLPAEVLAGQKDPRVKTFSVDAIKTLQNSKDYFDLVIIDLPSPSTVFSNRFYTTDFFKLVKDRLRPDGILAVNLKFPVNYQQLDLVELSASIYKSLSANYSFVNVLPEKDILYIATDTKIDYNPWILRKRFDAYNLKNKLVTKSYINYRLTNDQVEIFLDAIKKNKSAAANTNIRSAGYWYQNSFLFSGYHPEISRLLAFAGKINLFGLIIFSLIMFFTIFYSLDVLIKHKERILTTLTLVPSFSLLVAEMVLIFLFQVFYGSLYHRLGLIFAASSAGTTIGVWLISHLIAKNKIYYRYLFRLYLAISWYFLVLALILIYQPKTLASPAVFCGLVFAAGFLVGLEFPLINKYYLEKKFEPNKKTSTIYSANLIGAGLGAIFGGIFFLPVLGFSQTIIFLALLNFLACLALFFLRDYFEEK